MNDEVAFIKELERSDKERIEIEKEKLELDRLLMEESKKIWK